VSRFFRDVDAVRLAQIRVQQGPAHLGRALAAAGRLKHCLADRGRSRAAIASQHVKGMFGLFVSADRYRVGCIASVRQIVLQKKRNLCLWVPELGYRS
jgi:hypothetical protein